MVQHSHGPNDLGKVEGVKSKTGIRFTMRSMSRPSWPLPMFRAQSHVNNKFCEISGYSQHELIGQNHQTLARMLMTRRSFAKVPADRPRAGMARRNL